MLWNGLQFKQLWYKFPVVKIKRGEALTFAECRWQRDFSIKKVWGRGKGEGKAVCNVAPIGLDAASSPPFFLPKFCCCWQGKGFEPFHVILFCFAPHSSCLSSLSCLLPHLSLLSICLCCFYCLSGLYCLSCPLCFYLSSLILSGLLIVGGAMASTDVELWSPGSD